MFQINGNEKKNNMGIYDQVYQFLNKNTNLNLVFPKNEILKYKNQKPLYYKFDTHWNSFGAWVAYYELIDKIQKDFPELEAPLKQHEITYKTRIKSDFDLLKMINRPDSYSEEIEIPTSMKYSSGVRLDRPDYSGLSIFPGEFFENKQAPKIKMMMYRDSYGVDLVPYTNCHFYKSTYIWSPIILWQTIYWEKPNLVILEVTQRRMNDLFIANDSIITNQIVPKEVK
jgi:hypothetical protein